MQSLSAIIDPLQQALQSAGDPQVKAWWQGYVIEANPFYGVKMPVIRKFVNQWAKDQKLAKLPGDKQLDLAFALLACDHSEEKLAAALWLQEHLLPQDLIPQTAIAKFADAFDADHLNDWNICDWFCVKVLGPGIQAHSTSWAEPIHEWHTASNLWRARASLVAFVKVADQPAYDDSIARACTTLIQRPERFAKTAVGWILREISKRDHAFTRRQIEAHLPHYTIEVLNNALKYADKSERNQIKQRFKAL